LRNPPTLCGGEVDEKEKNMRANELLKKILVFIGIELTLHEKKKISIKRRFFIILFSLFVGGLLLLIGATKYSTSPSFCRSCHIMEPYYQAWAGSKHNKVNCVDCHYPPGKPEDHLWKKFQSLSQVAKYVTRTYSSRPYAEVEDSACLRMGCHSTRLLKSKVTFGKGIMFDHKPHLTEERRGRHLRCTSCHSQAMIGEHIKVTYDTCYLCHFKGFKEGRELNPLGGCTACHTIPEKEFKIQNTSYNHKDFVFKKGVKCQDCHLDSVAGDGEVDKDRCIACHNQPEKLEKLKDGIALHNEHVTKHYIACYRCHKEIKHSIKTTVKPLETDCNVCHSSMHNGSKTMLMGNGAIGVPAMPSPMYLANVNCVGCHVIPEADKDKLEFKGQTYKSSDSGCIKCHSKNYAGVLSNWKNISSAAIGKIQEKIKQAEGALDAGDRNAAAYKEAYKKIAEVKHNIAFLIQTPTEHNVYYASQIMHKADSDLESISKLTGKSLKNLDTDSVLSGHFCATLCHSALGVKVPADEVTFKSKKMPHKKHIDSGLSCYTCHAFGSHKAVKLIIKEKDCLACHDL